MKNFPLILFYFLLCLYSVRESKSSPSFPKDDYSVQPSGKVKTGSVTEQHAVPAHPAKADEAFSVRGFMEPELLVLLLLIMLLGMLHGRQPG